MSSREAFEEWLAGYEKVPFKTTKDAMFISWQAATAAALERAAEEVSRVDNETWFQNQSAFGIACRAAIRALKDETE